MNPLVKPIEAGKSTLISVKYNSEFRDLTYSKMNEIVKPAQNAQKATGMISGARNKRVAEKVKE